MEPNTELRAAREALPSPTFPGEPMSRAELAEAVNAHLWTSTERNYCLDAHMIARYERGAVRWPSLAYRSALRAVLGADTDADLGFFPTRRGSAAQPRETAEQVDDPLVDLEVSSPPPYRIGWTEVEHVRATTTAVALSENLFGGGLACAGAVAQLRWTTGLLSARATTEVRTALLEAVGNLASVVAYVAFDIADYAAADRCFQFALWCAEEGRSWPLRSNTLAEMSRKEAHLGQWDDALSLIEMAQVRSDRISSTARAMTSMLHGRFLALAGRIAEATDELANADGWMAAADPDLDPPWLCYYDAAEHQAATGRTLITIARHTGDPEPAARRLGDAIALTDDRYPRSRTFSRVRLATLLMTAGDVNTAATIGYDAVTEARKLRSRRVTAELHELERSCRPYQNVPLVAELRREIGALFR